MKIDHIDLCVLYPTSGVKKYLDMIGIHNLPLNQTYNIEQLIFLKV